MFGGGLTRQVETVFTVADKASAPARGIGAAFGSLARSATSVQGILGGIAVGGALKSVIDLGSSFEETALSIAGNIRAFDLAPTFQAAQAAATRALDVIDAKAAKLPGEAEQYVEVFKTALPKAIESGLTDMTKIADFTSQYTAVAIANQIDSTQAANDLFRMLSGQAGLDVRTFTSLQPHLKMTAKEFNALNAEQRRMAIENVLGKFAEPLEAASNTFGAKSGELISTFRKLAREASVPLFEGMKRTLEEITRYINTNRDSLLQMGRTISESVLAGLRAIPPVLKFMSDHMDAIKTAAMVFAGIWTAGTLAAGINSIITLMGSLATAVTAVNTAASAGILGKLVTGGAAVLGAPAAAAAATAAAPAAIAASIYGLYKLHENLSDQQAADFSARVARAPKSATLEAIERAAGITAGTTWTGGMADMVRDFLPGLRGAYQQSLLGTTGFRPEQVLSVAQSFGYAAEEVTRLADATSVANKVAAVGATGKGKGTSVNIQNARFDIKQSFAEGYDPDRIAVAFTDTLAKLGEYRGQSAFSLSGAMP
jgi:hypothetical protein